MIQGTDFDVAMKKVDLDASSIFVILYDQKKIRCEEANNIFKAAKRIVGEQKVLMIPDVCHINMWTKREMAMLRDYIDRRLDDKKGCVQ